MGPGFESQRDHKRLSIKLAVFFVLLNNEIKLKYTSPTEGRLREIRWTYSLGPLFPELARAISILFPPYFHYISTLFLRYFYFISILFPPYFPQQKSPVLLRGFCIIS